MAAGILVYSFMHYQESIPLINYIYYAVFLTIGSILYYSVRMIFIIPVFWMHTSRGLDDLFYGIEQTMQRPVDIFSGKFKKFLTTIIPLGVIVSYPVKMLWATNPLPLMFHMIIIVIVFWIIFKLSWQLGMKNYSSASS